VAKAKKSKLVSVTVAVCGKAHHGWLCSVEGCALGRAVVDAHRVLHPPVPAREVVLTGGAR
jgi:CBS-domain-containing membrane protein